jgi:hypothetical protein
MVVSAVHGPATDRALTSLSPSPVRLPCIPRTVRRCLNPAAGRIRVALLSPIVYHTVEPLTLRQAARSANGEVLPGQVGNDESTTSSLGLSAIPS